MKGLLTAICYCAIHKHDLLQVKKSDNLYYYNPKEDLPCLTYMKSRDIIHKHRIIEMLVRKWV